MHSAVVGLAAPVPLWEDWPFGHSEKAPAAAAGVGKAGFQDNLASKEFMVRLDARVDDGNRLAGPGSAEPRRLSSCRSKARSEGASAGRAQIKIDDSHPRVCGQRVQFRLGDVHRKHRGDIESQQAPRKSRTWRGIGGAAKVRADDRVLVRSYLRLDGRDGGSVPRRLIGKSLAPRTTTIILT